jgi:hypothetical protein
LPILYRTRRKNLQILTADDLAAQRDPVLTSEKAGSLFPIEWRK